MLAGRSWSVEHLAFLSVEARQMAARQRGPKDALAVDIAAARPVAGEGRLIDFGERGVGRIGPGGHSNHVSRVTQRCAPYSPVDRVHRDGIEARDDALVLRRVDRLARLDIIVAFAIAVGVDNERRPALGFLLVAGLLEHLAIEPAEDWRLRTA